MPPGTARRQSRIHACPRYTWASLAQTRIIRHSSRATRSPRSISSHWLLSTSMLPQQCELHVTFVCLFLSGTLIPAWHAGWNTHMNGCSCGFEALFVVCAARRNFSDDIYWRYWRHKCRRRRQCGGRWWGLGGRFCSLIELLHSGSFHLEEGQLLVSPKTSDVSAQPSYICVCRNLRRTMA